MKYLRRLRTRSRAGLMSSRCSTKAGRGPSPFDVTAPGTLVIAPRSPATASRSLTMDASPSPLSTQSIAPSPCSRMAFAVKEAL